MSEILTNENAIILASSEKMVELGTLGAQRLVAGKEDKLQVAEAWRIMILLRVYQNASELSDDDFEQLLYCLQMLSGESVFPTVSPIVGQEIINEIIVQSVTSITIQNNSVDLAIREKLNFRRDTQATDDGSVINVDFRDPLSSVLTSGSTITLDFENRVRKGFYGSASFSTPKTLAFSNDTNARVLDAFFFDIDAGGSLAITGYMADGRRVAGVWTPFDAGRYVMWGYKNATDWHLFVSSDKLST